MGIAIGVFFIILFVALYLYGAHLTARKNAMIEEANHWLVGIKARKALTPITTNLLLKAGEEAYLESPSRLEEARAERYYEGGGASVRIAKGVYVGGGSGASRSVQVTTPIDAGRLVLTNKRLIFDGAKEDRVILLDKIVSINPSINTIEVSSETRQKSMSFTVPNPFIWSTSIRLLSTVENLRDLRDVETSIQYKFE